MSIRLRLTVIYALILTGFFICFGIFSYLVSRNALLSAVDDNLESTALQILEAAEVVNEGDVTTLTFPEQMDLFQTSTVFMMAVDTNGEIIVRSSNLGGFQGLLSSDNLERDVPNFSVSTHYSQDLRVFSYPLITDNGGEPQLIGQLQVAQVLGNSYDALNQIGVVLTLMGGGVFFFFLLVGAYTTNNLLKPLDDITAVALKITRADDLSLRLPDSGKRDEMGQLTMALNQTLERLDKLFQAQRRLLADVSHELRTPLTTVRGNIDLMRRMGKYDPESLDIIQDELLRMTRLVGDLLLLARADGGSLPIRKVPLELDTILLDVFRQVQPLEEAQNVRVNLTEINPVRISGDPDRIKQLILILVDNAIKYSPVGGEVFLKLTAVDNTAQLAVIDTGPGIPSEHLPHIFDRFYRVDKARTRAHGGSGLGLPIAKWIAETHGGHIQVSSTPGKGTIFTIVLPIQPNELQETDPVKPRSRLRRPSILSLPNKS